MVAGHYTVLHNKLGVFLRRSFTFYCMASWLEFFGEVWEHSRFVCFKEKSSNISMPIFCLICYQYLTYVGRWCSLRSSSSRVRRVGGPSASARIKCPHSHKHCHSLTSRCQPSEKAEGRVPLHSLHYACVCGQAAYIFGIYCFKRLLPV